MRAPNAPTTRPPRASAPELGAVAGAVVGGERAAAQRLGHALVDQRAQQDVLEPVRDAAEREADQRDPQHRRERGAPASPSALGDDRGQRDDRQRRAAATRWARPAAPTVIPSVHAVISRP